METRNPRLNADGSEMTAEQHDAAARASISTSEAQAEEHRNMAAYLRRRDRANAASRRGE